MAADELKQAASLIRAGRGGEARPILARFLQANPASEDGWLLLSMVLRDRQQRIDCLRARAAPQPSQRRGARAPGRAASPRRRGEA